MEGSTFLSHHLSHPSLNLLLIDQTGNPSTFIFLVNLNIFLLCFNLK